MSMGKRRQRTLGQAQRGFTLIELMIATMVFSLVLLIVTFGILQITRVYFKGVTETNTQSVARGIMDTVSQAIQFGGGNVMVTVPGAATPSSPLAFCIGNERFTYALGYQLSDNPASGQHQTYHAMASDVKTGCHQHSTQPLNAPAIVGRELLSPNMRLANFKVESLGDSLYRVTVRIVYGDDDLLYSPATPGDPNGDLAPDASCRGNQDGTQFCAVSELSTVVVKRVQ